MKIGKIEHTRWIGVRVRKANWSVCSGTVLDIGTIYVLLQIFDHEMEKVVGLEIFNRLDDDWETYVDAEKLIQLLPVKHAE